MIPGSNFLRVAITKKSRLPRVVTGTPAFTALVASAAATAATSAAAAIASPATTPVFRFGSRFIDNQAPPVYLFPVKGGDRRLRFCIGAELHETESFGSAGVAVHDDLCGLHGAMWLKHHLQRTVRYFVGQIAYVQLLAHGGPPK